jgi:xanthine dehydrogenase YagR molybdenum-binding subunit
VVGLGTADLGSEARDFGSSIARPWPPNASLAVVGKPTPRIDGRAKVTGAARYTADVYLPGMLYARRVVSPHPHAIVKRVDTSKAERVKGVRAVYVVKVQEGATLADPSLEQNGKFPRIRYAGQCIAAVAATTPSIADEAARLVVVEYDVLPHVADIDAAMKDDAPRVYPGQVDQGGSAGGGGGARGLPQRGNIRGPSEQKLGDVEAGMRGAKHVIRRAYRTQVQTHSAMEPHGVVADWKPGRLTVWASTQGTATVRDELATVFKLPKSKVRVVSEFMGGGFGAKFGAGHFGVVAAQLSKQARAPVRLILDRAEEHTCVGNRPGTIQDLAIGAAADGALVAVDLTSHGTGGIAIGAGVGWAAMRMYPAPNLRSRQHDVFIHAGPSAAFRAPGMPQGMFALEQSVDELAEKLGVDPIALRDRLDVDRAGAPSTDPRSPLDPATAPPPPPGTPPPPAYDPKHPAIDRSARALERRIGAERIGWSRRHAPGVGKGPVKHGLGMAQSLWGRFVDLDSHCEVRIARDGSIVLRSSVADIGTGTRTAAAMLVAEELGRDPADIEVQIGDTRWPIGPASGGSKTLSSISPAIREAGAGARAKIVEAAAKKLGVAPETISVGRGTIGKLTWKQACAALPTEEIIVNGSRPPDWNGPPRGAIGGVQFAEVSVDVETGEVRVLRIVAVHDCGRPINPLALQSQINGGILQGISWALYEDRRLDRETGRVLNPNLDQYKILGARETPYIDVILLEQYVGRSSTDVHGIGEPANVATAAAVANAIYNAIGVRMRELPITPARILAGLRGVP